jgi:hypothetical protein
MQQHCRSCDSSAVDVTALSTWCGSTVDMMRQHYQRDVTALSITWQRCRSFDSAVVDVTALSMWCDSAVDVMWQHCRSCDSAVDHATVPSLMWQHCWHDATALSTWCDSAVDHATVPSLMWQHRQRDVTVLSIMWQCCRSCGSAVDRATVPSVMWQHCQRDARVLLIMWQCRRWCEGTVNMIQQHCQSCCQMIGSTIKWSTSVQSHAQQLCWTIDNKVIQRTVSCRVSVDSNDVPIVFPGCPLYRHIKLVCLCAHKHIRTTHFSSLNEQIFLKLLVGFAPKIEANAKHLTDLIDFFLFSLNLGDFKVHNHIGKYG